MDNARFTVWTSPPQPQMPETLFKKKNNKIFVHVLLGPDYLSGAEPGYRLGLHVSRRVGKNQTRLTGEVNSVQTTMATRTNSYQSAFMHVLSSSLPCYRAARQHVYSAMGLQQHAS